MTFNEVSDAITITFLVSLPIIILSPTINSLVNNVPLPATITFDTEVTFAVPVIFDGTNATFVTAPIGDTLITSASAPVPNDIGFDVKIISSPFTYPEPPLSITNLPSEP